MDWKWPKCHFSQLNTTKSLETAIFSRKMAWKKCLLEKDRTGKGLDFLKNAVATLSFKFSIFNLKFSDFQLLNFLFSFFVTILDTNFQAPIIYQFRNLTYLVILRKNVYFRLIKLPFFYPKKLKFSKLF